MKSISLKLVSYWHDGGDGGGGTCLYNNLDELRADAFEVTEWDSTEDDD